jgi:hypothetical protein
MPTNRKPTSLRTSPGFSAPVAKVEEKVVITEEPKVEEVIATPEPEPVVVAEVPAEAPAEPPVEVPVVAIPPTPPVRVNFAKKEPVKAPKVVKHPRNQPRFSPHK